MQDVATFDPTSPTSGIINTLFNGAGTIVIHNQSNVNLSLSFSNGYVDVAPAWQSSIFNIIEGMTPNIAWSQKSIVAGVNFSISEVNVISYQKNEKVPGTYPAPLQRQSNLGNSVPLTTAATSIVNSGNPTNTAIVTSQVVGDLQNAVNITNDAQVTFGDIAHPATVNVAGTENVTTENVGTSNITNANVGTLNVTTENVLGSSTIATLGATVANITTANVGTINSTSGANNLGTINLSNKLNLLKGSITRVGKATGSGTQTITHNWGHQADIVLPYYNGGFGVAPNNALFVFNENANSFTVTGQGTYSWTVFFLAF